MGQRVFEVAEFEDQHPVEQLATDGADPSLGDRVRPKRPYRGARDAEGFAGEHGIKTLLNLLSRSRIKNLKLATRSPRSISRFRASKLVPVHIVVLSRNALTGLRMRPESKRRAHGNRVTSSRAARRLRQPGGRGQASSQGHLRACPTCPQISSPRIVA
jgi:hypothetical protein